MNKITIRLKIGNVELQLEGQRQTVMEMLENDLPKIIGNITKVAHDALIPLQISPQPTTRLMSTQSQTPTHAISTEGEPYPTLQADSCADAIVALLSTDWGRRKPRTISEIKSALEANALHYSGKVIGFTLTRLTRRQKVRRWKSEEGYVYTSGP
jgi:hypothetical protein